MEDSLLTIPAAAQRLGRTTWALQKLIQRGKGPRSAVVDGRRVIRESDLSAYIAGADDSGASAC